LDQLRKVVPYVNEADVDFVVMEEGSKGGLFGRGKSEARVEARLRPAGERVAGDNPPSAEVLRAFVQTTVELMGIEAHVGAREAGEALRADISGDDLGLLIGRHGATIDALQYIAAIVVNGDRRERRQVIVDAEGYRERREVALSSLAERTAQTVVREGAAVSLQPMTAAERKVIHLHLKDHSRVETVSEGNEPFRAVVVSPKRPPG
jgi:spoIIIJ-associated protein